MSRMLFFSCSKYSGEDERRNARQISPLSVDWMRDGGWHDAGFWVTFVDVGFLYRREVMRPLGRRLSSMSRKASFPSTSGSRVNWTRGCTSLRTWLKSAAGSVEFGRGRSPGRRGRQFFRIVPKM